MTTSPATASPGHSSASGPPGPPGAGDHHFRTDHLVADLKRRSTRGGMVTLASQAIKFLLQTGSTMVLARMLTPGDFGLIAMVTAVIGFVAMFKDAGLSMATIQRAEINHGQVSTLFWINVGLSAAVMVTIAALAPAIAWFYGDPRLIGITLALSVNFLFGGLTVQHQALLRRQMKFRELAIIDILSMAAGIATAITMASAGMGYWSLVGLTAGSAVANCALVWMFSGWRPGRPVRRSGVRPMLRFGASLTLASVCNQVREQFPYIMIGYSLGSGQLALYERAYRLLVMPLTTMMPAISAVVIPALSRVQDDTPRLRRIIRMLTLLVVSFSLPISIIGVVLAPELVLFLLGPQWADSAVIFACLAPLAATQAVSTVATWVLTTGGKGGVLLQFSVINAVLAAASVVFGLRFGLVGAALSFSVVGCLIRTPMLYAFVIRNSAVTLGDLLAQSRLMLILGVVLAVVGLLVREQATALLQSPWLWALSFVCIVAACWIPMLILNGVPQLLRSLRTM